MMQFGPFFGATTKVDPKFIPNDSAADLLNVRLEDGTLQTRYGYRDVAASQATAVYGCVFLSGYNSSNAAVEEYITFETVSGNTRAFYRNSTTGAATQINGTNRNASAWTGISFNQYGYLINPNESTPVFRREIGSATSFVALQHPATPTTALGLAPQFQATAGQPYQEMSWVGTDAIDITVTGAATTTNFTSATGEMVIQHAASSNTVASWEVDLSAITAGVQDFQYNDVFAMTITMATSAFSIDQTGISAVFTNNDGSPISFAARVDVYASPLLNPRGGATYALRFQFDDKVRASWDNIKKIKLSYKVAQSSGTATNNQLTVSKLTVGCCLMKFPAERTPGQLAYFGYSYYYSGGDMESGVGGTTGIGNSGLNGYFPYAFASGVPGLGVWLGTTMTTSGDANVDFNRLYFMDGSTHRLIVTQTDATPTYLIKMSATEILNITSTYSAKPFKYTRCTNAFAFKGWVVWLYQNEGLSNVRHSRIGEPEKQSDTALPGILDETDDLSRGASFTLADDAGDYPLAGCEAGDAAIILGVEGVYAQVGDKPSTMTPPKKLPGSIGIANKFAYTRLRTDAGSIGVAYVARDASGIYFVQVNTAFDGEEGQQVIELSDPVRPTVQSFFITEAGLTLSQFQEKVRIWSDESSQSLWVMCGSRAMVLRRPGADGQRSWEFYRYNTGSTEFSYPVSSFVSGHNRWVTRCLMSGGAFSELEWNASGSTPITGSNRDAGRPMPNPYWKSRTVTGERSFVRRVGFFRDDLGDTPTVTITSTRQTATYSPVAGKIYAKGSPLQSGFEHLFKFNMTEDMGRISRVEVEFTPIGKGKHL